MRRSTLNLIPLLLLLFAIAVLPAWAQKNAKKTANLKPDTAVKAAFVPTADQRAILDEVNAVRSNPAKYAKFLEGLKASLKGKILNLPDGKMLLTKNGADSFDDAIRDLKSTAPLKPFAISGGLSAAANLQLTDLKENLKLGHYGKDGGDLEVRLLKIGDPGPLIAENISYYSENARQIVLNMILDESSESRAHRKNLLSANLKLIGIAFGQSTGNVPVCVMNFADRFEERQGGKGAIRVN